MTSPESCLQVKFLGQCVPLAGAMPGFAGFGSRTDFTLVTQVLCSPGTTYWKCQIWNGRHFQGNPFSVFLPAEARCGECFRAGSAVGPALVGLVSTAELQCKLWLSCSTAAALHSYPRLMLLFPASPCSSGGNTVTSPLHGSVAVVKQGLRTQFL